MPRSYDYSRWFGTLASNVRVRRNAGTILPGGPDEALVPLACEFGPPQPGPTLEVAWESPIAEYEVWATLRPFAPSEDPP